MKCLYYLITFWILLSAPCLSYKSSAQQITFNKRIGILDSIGYEYSTSILETKNGYLVAGGGHDVDSLGYLIFRIYLYETDHEGDTLWSKVYTSNDSVRYGGSFRGIFQLNDSVYEAIGEYFDFTDSVFEPTYYQFDMTGNIISQKVLYEVNSPDAYYLLLSGVIKTLDGGFFFSATLDDPYSERVMKFDAGLNLQWERIYYGYRIIEVGQNKKDSTFFFAAGAGSSVKLIRLDKNGGTIFEEYDSGPMGNNMGVASTTKDDGYILASPYITEGFYTSRVQLSKFDASGNRIWSKVFNKDYRYLRMHQVHCDIDGSIVLMGGFSLDNGNFCSYLFRFSENGDSLQFKLLEAGDDYTHCTIYGSCMTRDFYVLGVGIVSYQNPDNQQRLENWLLKLDWYGCDSAVCDNATVYIDDFTTLNLVCRDPDEATLNITARGDSISCKWQKWIDDDWLDLADDAVYSGTETETLTINRSQAGSDSVYRCKVFDLRWERYTPDLVIREIGPPTVAPLPDSLMVVEHSDFTLHVSASGYEDISYQWYHNGTPVPEGDSPQLILKNIGYSDNGIYNCIVSNRCGEVTSDTIFLFVLGRNEVRYDRSMVVYPNPNNGKFRVLLKNNLSDGVISIHTLTGSRIYEKAVTGIKSNFIELDKNILPGCYFIRFTDQKRTFSTKFILTE